MSIAAPKPANEEQRLAALGGYGVLDTKREEAFDDLTRIASQICGTPMALVSLIDEHRQWFKSEVGLGASETPRELAFCAHAILQDKVFLVPDAKKDIRFHDNALVTGAPHLRFYAGAPLQTPEGYALGTLCVLDRVPRQLSEDQKAALEALARQTMAQLELRRQLKEAEQIGRYRNRLMAVMGHDLKQPVSTIQMSLMLLEPSLQGTEDKQTLEYAKGAIGTLSNELDSLAQASRLDRDSLQLARVPIERVLSGIQDNWHLRARSKGLTLRVVPSDAVLETDEKLLSTILGNLVGNAIKYTQQGGVLVGVRRRADTIRVEVWDTGVGIPEGARGKIFESFSQLDCRSEGLGLGLAIVRRTAELLGVTIDVSSRVGRGSCFAVTLKSSSRANGAMH
ncbi:MAG TPA: GAF domain-containing sensor histidine kinase [Alphaproteobacteria bacterium]|nr:GAF domain-containing sensor histidine kinase [Alphaproteobacteria bacterium]